MRHLQWLVILGAAFAGSLAGLFVIVPLSLIISELVIYPLALGVAALLASLSAIWAQRRTATDGLLARIWPVVGLTEASAAMIAALLFGTMALHLRSNGPAIWPMSGSAVVLAGSAVAAVWSCRAPRDGETDDARITIGLLVLAALAVPVIAFAASLAGLAGA